jgi:hypothetical protein
MTEHSWKAAQARFLHCLDSKNVIAATDFRDMYRDIDKHKVSRHAVAKRAKVPFRTISGILHDDARKTVTVKQAKKILFALLEENFLDYTSDLYMIRRKDNIVLQLETQMKILARRIEMCKYLVGPNVDFPTLDKIEASKARTVVEAFMRSNPEATTVDVDVKCGFRTGTTHLLFSLTFITEMNYDVVVHMCKRLMGQSTRATVYEQRFNTNEAKVH